MCKWGVNMPNCWTLFVKISRSVPGKRSWVCKSMRRFSTSDKSDSKWNEKLIPGNLKALPILFGCFSALILYSKWLPKVLKVYRRKYLFKISSSPFTNITFLLWFIKQMDVDDCSWSSWRKGDNEHHKHKQIPSFFFSNLLSISSFLDSISLIFSAFLSLRVITAAWRFCVFFEMYPKYSCWKTKFNFKQNRGPLFHSYYVTPH